MTNASNASPVQAPQGGVAQLCGKALTGLGGGLVMKAVAMSFAIIAYFVGFQLFTSLIAIHFTIVNAYLND